MKKEVKTTWDAKETNPHYSISFNAFNVLDIGMLIWLWLWLWFLGNHFVCQTYLLYYIWIWMNITSPINLLRWSSGISFDHVMSESWNWTDCVFSCVLHVFLISHWDYMIQKWITEKFHKHTHILVQSIAFFPVHTEQWLP